MILSTMVATAGFLKGAAVGAAMAVAAFGAGKACCGAKRRRSC